MQLTVFILKMDAVHDFEAERALVNLIDRATSGRNEALDLSLVHRIKQLCRASEASLRTAFAHLFDRLHKNHSQTRLLALDIIAQLFDRSVLFRSLLAAKFSEFLAAVLGFRVNHPLPPPTASATQLRRRALELIEKWNSTYSSHLPQIALGYAYIKDTWRFEFPEIDARATAAEEAQRQREARAQQIAQERYQRLLQEWPTHVAESTSLLRQFDAAFDLFLSVDVEAEEEDEEEDVEGLEWEDVVGGDEKEEEDGNEEGLAAYTAKPVEDDSCCNAARIRSIDSEEDCVSVDELDSVVETLQGLYKVICNTALPSLQDTLRIIVRATVGSPGEAQHAQRERLLRAATALKTDLTLAKDRFEGAHLDVAAMVQSQARRRVEQKEEEMDMEKKKKKQGNNRIAAINETPAAAVEEEEKEEQQQRNPYHFIRDPTAPLKPFIIGGHGHGHGGTPTNRNATISVSNSTKQCNTTSTTSSSLPASLRQSLASRAPVLPSSAAFVQVWDSAAAVGGGGGANSSGGTSAAAAVVVPQYMNRTGLEVSNHWGPVDVHQELPPERIEELFLYAPREQQQQTTRSTISPRIARAIPPPPLPPRRINESTTLAQGTTAAMSSQRATTTEGRRLQRAAERAYNDAVIAAAAGGSDEALAQAMSAASAGGNGGGEAGTTSAPFTARDRGVHKKRKGGGLSIKERLQKKLLSGRAVGAALADSAVAEGERAREKFGANRWENK